MIYKNYKNIITKKNDKFNNLELNLTTSQTAEVIYIPNVYVAMHNKYFS